MPNITERQRTLLRLESLIFRLAIQFAVQSIMYDEDYLLNEETQELLSEPEDAEYGEREDNALLFNITGYRVIAAVRTAHLSIANSRYFYDRRIWRGLRALRTEQLEFLFGMDCNWFKNTFRLDYDGYMFILNQIKDDNVFRNNSRNHQAPVEYQLLVALSKMGNYGNSVGTLAVARQFRIAEGTGLFVSYPVLGLLEVLYYLFSDQLY